VIAGDDGFERTRVDAEDPPRGQPRQRLFTGGRQPGPLRGGQLQPGGLEERAQFFLQSASGQVRQGEEGGQDAGHRDGRFHRLLVALLRGQPAERNVPQLHRARGTRQCHRHLARLDQLFHEPCHLRLLEQRL